MLQRLLAVPTLKSFLTGPSVGAMLAVFVVGCQDQPLALDEQQLGGPSFDLSGDPFVDPGSHFRYLTMNWVPTGNPGEVEFRIRAVFRRSFQTPPAVIGQILADQGTRLDFGDGSSPSNPTLPFVATLFDASADWVLGEANLQHTYTGPGPFTAILDGCCRLDALNNRRAGRYGVQTVVTFDGNRPPVTGLPPIVFVPKLEVGVFPFFVPGSDPDGDPVRWRLSTSAEAGGGSHPPALSVDPSTGVLLWQNAGLNTVDFWTVQIVMEDLDETGDPKSKVGVDFLLKIVDDNKRIFVDPTPADGTVFEVLPGTQLLFTMKAEHSDQSEMLTLSQVGLPLGASFVLPAAANPVQSTFSWTPTPSDEGTHVVVFTALDNAGIGSLPRSYTINVRANRAPTADAGPDQTLGRTSPLGVEVTLDGSGSTDPEGSSTIVSYVWTDADGDIIPNGVSPTVTLGVGTHTITLVVTDGGGLTDDAVVVIEVSNAPPVANAGGPYTGTEGTAVSFDGSGSSDPNGDDLTYSWDFGDGSPLESGATPTHAYVDNDTYTVTLTVTDPDDESSIAEATATIANVNPTVDAGADISIDEGDTFVRSGSFTDPGADTWSATVDYGDGTGTNALTLNGVDFNLSHTYADDGTFAVTVKITDDDAGEGAGTVTITVNNLAPTVDAGADATLVEGDTFVRFGAFTDPGLLDTWSATVDYGDGTGTQVLALNGTGFDLNHPYADAGIFTVTVTVTDDDGGEGLAFATVTVLSLQEATQSLIDEVNLLAGVLGQKGAEKLVKRLDQGIKKLEKGRPDQAIKKLEHFIKDVLKLIDKGTLSLDDGQPLIDAAQAIIDALAG